MPNGEPEKYAVKVDHLGAIIPAPTKELLEEVARGVHLAVAGSAMVDMQDKDNPLPNWDTLPDNVKNYWREGARCSYAIIALHGGGSVEQLKPDAK